MPESPPDVLMGVEHAEPATVRRLHALLELSGLSRGQDLDAVLEAVTRSILESMGYRTVVVNLYRPAWDDFECVVVEGSEEARDALLGIVRPWSGWEWMFQDKFERCGAYFLRHELAEWEDGDIVYTPEIAISDDPDAWHPEDCLIVPLLDETGGMVGTLSVDEPANGRRPTDEELQTLVALAGHAALAISQTRATLQAERYRTALNDLLKTSSDLSPDRPLPEVLDRLCGSVQRGLGFEKVAVFLRDRDADADALRVAAARGFGEQRSALDAPLSLLALQGLFEEHLGRDGCILVDRDTAAALVASSQVRVPSRRNGRGPRAWRGHWLVLPLADEAGATDGLLWVDDPEDRLLPTPERLQLLRLFADQAASATAADRRVQALRHLAEHDPLTGVYNRRDLSRRIDAARAAGDVAVLICDLDRFKAVNDDLGHDMGDRVLERFGTLLREHSAPAGHAVRLGGEEFCVVLPGATGGEAFACAERLRRASRVALQELAPGVTLSVGIATTAGGGPDSARALLMAADRALYMAKRLGRDRSVPYDASMPSIPQRRRGERTEQLSAVLLLAEALDLRDGGTSSHSRTVAQYTELTGRALGLSQDRVERLRVAGALHDIGKIGVADAILRKPGPLTEAEWEDMRRHAELGAQITAHAGLDDISEWVLCHHETLDGRGYPRALRAAQIPLEARVLAVTDAYEAMTADRPYRRALGDAAARSELHRCAGTQFDAEVVAAFIGALDARDCPLSDAA
jgi:diguanylate cyclase (GGDEF)-like protein